MLSKMASEQQLDKPENSSSREATGVGPNGPKVLDKERILVNEDPKWHDREYLLKWYKTEACMRPLCRQDYACPQFHNSKDRRRDPHKHKYKTKACPNVKLSGERWGEPSNCDAGDNCSFCHTRNEQQFHSAFYKMTDCFVHPVRYCQRSMFCPFTHVARESDCSESAPTSSLGLPTNLLGRKPPKRLACSIRSPLDGGVSEPCLQDVALADESQISGLTSTGLLTNSSAPVNTPGVPRSRGMAFAKKMTPMEENRRMTVTTQQLKQLLQKFMQKAAVVEHQLKVGWEATKRPESMISFAPEWQRKTKIAQQELKQCVAEYHQKLAIMEHQNKEGWEATYRPEATAKEQIEKLDAETNQKADTFESELKTALEANNPTAAIAKEQYKKLMANRNQKTVLAEPQLDTTVE